jgi:hypothetical protein
MAYHYPDVSEDRKARIATNVNDFFSWCRAMECWEDMTDWDGNGGVCVDTEVRESFDSLRPDDEECDDCPKNPFNQIVCCIRAGFDVAVKPSGGVVGFTAGDVREMWDNKVPDWVKAFWDGFDEIPDDEDVWL